MIKTESTVHLKLLCLSISSVLATTDVFVWEELILTTPC